MSLYQIELINLVCLSILKKNPSSDWNFFPQNFVKWGITPLNSYIKIKS